MLVCVLHAAVRQRCLLELTDQALPALLHRGAHLASVLLQLALDPGTHLRVWLALRHGQVPRLALHPHVQPWHSDAQLQTDRLVRGRQVLLPHFHLLHPAGQPRIQHEEIDGGGG
eukprot:9798920-Lingulodinium_polyedra.AAC.1